jgi:hypothetical protein
MANYAVLFLNGMTQWHGHTRLVVRTDHLGYAKTTQIIALKLIKL